MVGNTHDGHAHGLLDEAGILKPVGIDQGPYQGALELGLGPIWEGLTGGGG